MGFWSRAYWRKMPGAAHMSRIMGGRGAVPVPVPAPAPVPVAGFLMVKAPVSCCISSAMSRISLHMYLVVFLPPWSACRRWFLKNRSASLLSQPLELCKF